MFRPYSRKNITDSSVDDFNPLLRDPDKAKEFHDYVKDIVCDGIEGQNLAGYYKEYEGEDGFIYRSNKNGDGIVVIGMKESDASTQAQQNPGGIFQIVAANEVVCVADEVAEGAFDLDVPYSTRTINITKLNLPFATKVHGKATNNQVLLGIINAPNLTSKNRKMLFLDTRHLDLPDEMLPDSPMEAIMYPEEITEETIKGLGVKKGSPEYEDRVLHALLDIRTADKPFTTIEETASLYSIGENRLRAWIKNEPEHPSIIWVNTKALIKRKAFEDWLEPLNTFPY